MQLRTVSGVIYAHFTRIYTHLSGVIYAFTPFTRTARANQKSKLKKIDIDIFTLTKKVSRFCVNDVNSVNIFCTTL